MIYENAVRGMNSSSMRGINASIESFSSSTSMFVDGVPLTGGLGFEEMVVDAERIEVLRGPQGTLYGTNSEVGAINIITKQPGNETRAMISLAGGMLLSGVDDSPLTGGLKASVSGPLVEDTLFYSLVGSYSRKVGYIEHIETGEDVNDKEDWFGRGKIHWTPNQNFSMTLTFSHLRYNDGAPDVSLNDAGAAAYGLPPFENRSTVSSNIESENKSYANSFAANIHYKISEQFGLTSVTTYREYNDRAFIDWDFSFMTLLHMNKKDNKYAKLSQEVRLDYTNHGLKWLTGVYLDKDENDLVYDLISDIPSINFSGNEELTGKSYAAFTHLTVPLGSKFNLVGGLRYGYEERDQKNNIAGTGADADWTSLNPKIAFEYSVTSDIMTYVSAARGDRSGGFNLMAFNPDYLIYDGEKLWSYEWGIKSSLWNNRILLNGNLYYMDISDMQVTEAVSAYQAHMTNAAEATAWGAEADMKVSLSRELTFLTNAGYNNIEFDEFSDALGNYKGNKPPLAPKYTFYLGTQYRHPDGWYGSVGITGYGKMYFDKTNTASREAYELVDVKLGYEMDHIDVYLYGRNIFDKEYDSEGFGDVYTIFSEPGEVGLQMTFRF
jgi:iron complex outermembrane receptor protein